MVRRKSILMNHSPERLAAHARGARYASQTLMTMILNCLKIEQAVATTELAAPVFEKE
jgi:hypothetical protein